MELTALQITGLLAIIGASLYAVGDVFLLAGKISLDDYPKLKLFAKLLSDAEKMIVLSPARMLYSNKGRYSDGSGFNRVAVIALLLGIFPNVPGFLAAINVVPPDAMPAWINDLYHYAWFVGFFVSGAIYLVLSKPDRLTVVVGAEGR